MYNESDITEALRNLLASPSEELNEMIRDGDLEVAGIVDGEFFWTAAGQPADDDSSRVPLIEVVG